VAIRRLSSLCSIVAENLPARYCLVGLTAYRSHTTNIDSDREKQNLEDNSETSTCSSIVLRANAPDSADSMSIA
jgi:hypothetical protein